MLPPRNEDEPRRGPRICTIGRTPYMCHIRQSSLLHPLFSFVCPLQKHGLDGPKSTDCGREWGDERTRSSQSISQTPFSCFRHHPFYSQPSSPFARGPDFLFLPQPPHCQTPGQTDSKGNCNLLQEWGGWRKEKRGGARVWKRKLFRLYCRRLGKGGGKNGAVLIGRKEQKEKEGRKDGEIQEQDSPKSSMVAKN